MSFTISARVTITSSETLMSTVLEKCYAAWSVSGVSNRVVSVAYGQLVYLDAATTYAVVADPLASVVLGWTQGSNTVEVPVNQLTIASPPANAYLRNTSTDSTSTPVPVTVIEIGP